MLSAINMAIRRAPAPPGRLCRYGPGHPRLQPEAMAFRGWLNPLGVLTLGYCCLLPPLTSPGIPAQNPRRGCRDEGAPAGPHQDRPRDSGLGNPGCLRTAQGHLWRAASKRWDTSPPEQKPCSQRLPNAPAGPFASRGTLGKSLNRSVPPLPQL